MSRSVKGVSVDENRVASADVSEWLRPQDAPPPRGVKLLLRTTGDVAVIGTWSDVGAFTHWSPLPRLRRDPPPIATGYFGWALGTVRMTFLVEEYDDQRVMLRLKRGADVIAEVLYFHAEDAVADGADWLLTGVVPTS
jgi:hypothetical protein